ncbi:E3 ubiquitin/ISG15 ligase TRIM25 isoform X2 [Cheilinus undulatus]|uniref:E3 ubiquitin/ISG15 ligase TRIM25 isoform X2 n=1 Tax=Cheilinus undulatus TaxID=241271 RepID=UPI001BD2F331|nr:E3 ubiquitin/ISG15 ligase TRIM25 isoform X2 [Cheilinus undulatus]
MADMDQSQFSLLSLEDELTCSICLSTFDCPVTLPCGHNFCQACLFATWKDSYSCPQCRTLFATRPELKKNTVLSTVVKTFSLRSAKNEDTQVKEEVKEQKRKDVIRCDTCMEAEASKTCLTCMASFCEEHLRPHRENPIFRLHQQSEPVSDLLQRICPDHHKLMELFCSKHNRPICSFCLQEVHKGCPFISPEEQRNQKESDLRGKLLVLDEKIAKNDGVLSQMTDVEQKLKDVAANRRKALVAEYQQMRDMLAKEELEALTVVDRELESGQSKLSAMKKKFTDNINSLSKAKGEINSLLSQSQTLAFLQTSFDLPQSANFDPYNPRANLDSKKMTITQAFAFALKQHLTEILKQPIETRQLTLKPGKKEVPASGPASSGSKPDNDPQKRKPRSHSPGRPPVPPLLQTAPGWQHANFFNVCHLEPQWFLGGPVLPGPHTPGSETKEGLKKKRQRKPKKGTEMGAACSVEDLLDLDGKDKPGGQASAAELTETAETSDISPSITSAEKRSELLKYGTVLTLDPKTAHKRITLKEDFTTASVSDEHTDYPDCPERFSVCSQVLASKGFSRGRHYWEVRLSSNNFVGIGLAYNSIDRKGPTSRLGRNAQSWCVEWFNVKLSAWFNSRETILENPNSKRVGVLLDCDKGIATFYNVADRAYPFHSFVFPFTEAVYPAFWIFSCGSSISLCKLQ